jgi:hypothetical protein
MLSGEVANSNSIVFGLTRPEPEHTIYHLRDKHANNYNTDAGITDAGTWMGVHRASFLINISWLDWYEEVFEDAKGVIRIRKSKKDRQHIGQKKKYKKTKLIYKTLHRKLNI